MTDMREAVARAIWEAGANASTTKWENASHDAKLIVYQKADAALSLMQPEIDRRVAEERARLLERLQDPSEGMCKAGYLADDLYPRGQCDTQKELHRCFSEPRWKAMLTAFQQDNSDA